MSHVTDCLLLWDSLAEGTGALDAANAYLRRRYGAEARGLVHADAPGPWWGGHKARQAEAAGGSFHALDVPEFIAHLRALPWASYDAEWAQLVYQDEHELGFTLVDVYRHV